MRIYIATADCLVDDVLLHFNVIARNEREAWIKAYLVALNNPVMDSGTIDVVRKNLSIIDNQFNSKENKSWI